MKGSPKKGESAVAAAAFTMDTSESAQATPEQGVALPPAAAVIMQYGKTHRQLFPMEGSPKKGESAAAFTVETSEPSDMRRHRRRLSKVGPFSLLPLSSCNPARCTSSQSPMKGSPKKGEKGEKGESAAAFTVETSEPSDMQRHRRRLSKVWPFSRIQDMSPNARA